MNLPRHLISRSFTLSVICLLGTFSAFAQSNDSSSQAQQDSSSQSQQDTVEGTVVSASRTTFVVRSDDNHFHLFTFDRSSANQHAISVGAQVRVESDQGNEDGARHATSVTRLNQAQEEGTSAARRQNLSTANRRLEMLPPIPASIRDTERQIEHQARRWRIGARAGVGLDPELILFGVHSQMGPIFSRNVFFRPNADFEWGEVTDMVALNLEAVYRLRTSVRNGNWAPYLGGGPALNFIHQGFKSGPGEGRDISFGNFDYETGLNLLMGMENRHGTFFELKTSLYSQPAPVFRFIVGKNF